MHTGMGQVVELVLEDGIRLARISCPPNMIPTPGQYLLVSDASANTLLPVPIFYTDFAAEGFIAAPLVNRSWSPGQPLYLRGPLGRGLELPAAARKVALVAFDDTAVRLRGLIRPSLRQEAAVVLVSGSASQSLPDEVEVQPLSALADVMSWADYLVLDAARENLLRVGESLGRVNQAELEHSQHLHPVQVREAQVLVRTPMPCGGLAECGVCSVRLKTGWKLACKEGPVMDWRELG